MKILSVAHYKLRVHSLPIVFMCHALIKPKVKLMDIAKYFTPSNKYLFISAISVCTTDLGRIPTNLQEFICALVILPQIHAEKFFMFEIFDLSMS